jgi:hypothetical protein
VEFAEIAQRQFRSERLADEVGGRSTRKHGEATVTFTARTDHLSAVFGDKMFNQHVVARQGSAHRVSIAEPGSSAAL